MFTARGDLLTTLFAGPTLRSLRKRNARVFFAGLLVSNVGTWLQLTAMSLLVYRITGRATDLGITVALQFLPMLLLGTWAGAVADGRDKRTMAIVTQALLAAQAIVLGLIDLAGLATVPVVWSLTLVVGVLGAFENPARRGLVTELVEPADIANATSLNTAVMTGSRIFGPALAALMVDTVGTAWCFLLNGISFTAVLASLLALRPDELYTPPRRAPGGKPVREAIAFVVHHEFLLVVMVAMAIISTFAFNYSVSLPKLADARWGGEEHFGLVLSASSVGSMIGALVVARVEVIRLRTFLVMSVLLGVSGIGMAWAPNLGSALAWSIPLGLGGAGFVSATNGITQQESPPDMRGRLLALTAVLFLGSTPIGGPITGLIGDRVGAEWSLAYGSVITLVTAAVAAIVLRRGRHAASTISRATEARAPGRRR
ncbi:MAG: MFS transporter [Desertimonas sp.]